MRAFLLVLWMMSVPAVAVGAAAASKPSSTDTPSAKVDPRDLKDLDRDDAAAEAAADRGDLAAALRFMDYFGHEQEDFASAMLEYGRDQRKLERAVVAKLGPRAWRRAAATLGVPPHRGREGRSVRREGDVLLVRNRGAEHDVPYVKVDGVWKVSVRDVLLNAVKARLGDDAKVEEADLHVLAGKMAQIVRQRGGGLSGLADAVRAGKVASDEDLRQAAEALGRGGAAKTANTPGGKA